MASLLSRQTCSLPRPARQTSLVPVPRSLHKNIHLSLAGTSSRAGGTLACRASDAQPSGSVPARHAVLHDFCMCIPYGAISIVGGIVLFFLSLTSIAGTALVAGATSLAASVLSLQEWKAGGDCKTYTLTSAASAAAVAYATCASLNLLKGLPYWVSLALCVVSTAASAFCVYNVLAGGNPPPRKAASPTASSNSTQ